MTRNTGVTQCNRNWFILKSYIFSNFKRWRSNRHIVFNSVCASALHVVTFGVNVASLILRLRSQLSLFFFFQWEVFSFYWMYVICYEAFFSTLFPLFVIVISEHCARSLALLPANWCHSHHLLVLRSILNLLIFWEQKTTSEFITTLNIGQIVKVNYIRVKYSEKIPVPAAKRKMLQYNKW